MSHGRGEGFAEKAEIRELVGRRYKPERRQLAKLLLTEMIGYLFTLTPGACCRQLFQTSQGGADGRCRHA